MSTSGSASSELAAGSGTSELIEPPEYTWLEKYTREPRAGSYLTAPRSPTPDPRECGGGRAECVLLTEYADIAETILEAHGRGA